MQDFTSDPRVAAAKAAMNAKSGLEIKAQEKRVRDVASEVDRRLRALARLVSEVSAEVSAARDLETGGTGYPQGVFGRDAQSLDEGLQALDREVSNLHGLREADRLSREIGAEFEDAFADLAASMNQPEQPQGDPIPMGGGQYL